MRRTRSGEQRKRKKTAGLHSTRRVVSALEQSSEMCPFQAWPFRVHYNRGVIALARPLTSDMHRNRCPALFCIQSGSSALSQSEKAVRLDVALRFKLCGVTRTRAESRCWQFGWALVQTMEEREALTPRFVKPLRRYRRSPYFATKKLNFTFYAFFPLFPFPLLGEGDIERELNYVTHVEMRKVMDSFMGLLRGIGVQSRPRHEGAAALTGGHEGATRRQSNTKVAQPIT